MKKLAQKVIFFILFIFIQLSCATTNVQSQTTNCSLNIYPSPANGTNDYTVTFLDKTTTPFVGFANNWYDGDTPIGNAGTGTINSITLPTGWTNIGTQPYEARGSSSEAVQQVTYQINLTLNNYFGGIDVAQGSTNPFADDICTGHQSPLDITYNAPTPPPTLKLSVPILLQTSNPWGSEIYDGASNWNRASATIGAWGCTLTSYAMVLNYFGINKLPSGTNLNPGTLNTWLKNNNGYIDGVSSGYVNPLAIVSLSKKVKHINSLSFDALEYTRYSGNNIPLLNDELNKGIPPILEESGHFIVAKGINGDSFDINDPYFPDRTQLTAYGNTFISLSELKPSNTNLSYIMIVSDKDTNLEVKDLNNIIQGEQFLQDSLVNDNSNQRGGNPIKILYFKKPPSGQYALSLTSPNQGPHNIKIYFYDQNGNLNLDNIDLMLSSYVLRTVNLSFNIDKSNISNSNMSITIDNLIEDILMAKKSNLINNRIASALLSIAKDAKKNYQKKFKIVYKLELSTMETLLKSSKILIKQNVYDVLLYDLQRLNKII